MDQKATVKDQTPVPAELSQLQLSTDYQRSRHRRPAHWERTQRQHTVTQQASASRKNMINIWPTRLLQKPVHFPSNAIYMFIWISAMFICDLRSPLHDTAERLTKDFHQTCVHAVTVPPPLATDIANCGRKLAFS